MKDSLNDLQKKFENLKQENFQLEQDYFDRLKNYAEGMENSDNYRMGMSRVQKT